MIEINKKFYEVLIILSVIGIGFSVSYVYKNFINDDDKYFIGYQNGSKVEHIQKHGYYDGLDHEGTEPTANKLLDLAIDSYLYVTDSDTTDAKGDMKEAGYRDGYIYMYMSNYIEGFNSRDD